MNDTIIALATPAGKSGVAIIRISGENALVAAHFLGVKKPLTPRMAHYCELQNPHTKTPIDSSLVIYFVAPHSFTGENLLELQCHGSKAVLDEVIELLLKSNLVRYAEAGEFTRRALENGKMDLLQAEALADLIDAETVAQRNLALRQMGGEVSRKFQALEDATIEVRAFAEVHLDFPDDDIPHDIDDQLNARIDGCMVQIEALLKTAIAGKAIREGVQVAIIGVPNAGKSTLLNAIAGKRVAITSHMAGTTRDAISHYRQIDGVVYCFTDTAGIRQTQDEIENEGILIAKDVGAAADLQLCVIDLTQEIALQWQMLEQIVSRETILICNKVDLLGDAELKKQKTLLDELQIVSRETIYVSANSDIEAAINVVKKQKNIVINDAIYVTRTRHVVHLQAAMEHLQAAQVESEMVLKAQFLIYACNEIGMILGKINIEKVLDVLFSSFCIGK